MRYKRFSLAIIIPALIVFFLFHTFPMLTGFFYSFTDFRGYGDYDFVGIANYQRLFTDPGVRQAYGFTITYAVIATVLSNVLSLIIALGLSAKIKMRGALRATFFLPAVLPIIVVGFVFKFVFGQVLPQMGIGGLSQNILGTDKAWIAIVIVGVWQSCAVTIVLYLAGIQTVPEDVMEAATIDGAGSWRKFWSVTFPLIAPFFTINMVLSLKNFLMVFDLVIALTNGGPGTSTQSVAFQIYRNGFAGGQFAYQSANAVIFFLLIALLSFAQQRWLGGREQRA
ncbi:sugar ABC transporter permease [Actinomycetaceae bacterium MB13-C1-2]|nr:sugar ABC transporter permease [Actinomycetaceae bacterium MB13-C1-2]